MAIFYHNDTVYAVDNRCPHMGFPLSRGTVCEGLLTCHWHNARFDLASGGTLDPFADDVRAFPTVIRDGEVFVDVSPEALVIEATGTEEKIDSIIEILRPYGFKELVRTGKVAMLRGNKVAEEAPAPDNIREYRPAPRRAYAGGD